MANADGAIVLTVEIDTGGLGGEMSKLKSAINSSLGGLESFDTKTNQVNNITNVFNQTIIQTINNITQMSSVTQKNVTQLNVYEKATTKAKNATTSLQNAAKKFLSSLGIYLSLRQLVRFSNEASKLASQTEAYVKRLSMLYGEAAQDVYDFANANAHAFGMAKSQAYEALADYGNILSDTYSGQEMAQLSNDLLQTTAVIASQTGRTYDDVFEKIRSGLYGNTRAIDDLGLSVRKAGLMATQAWNTVSQNGTKSWNDLTDTELQQLRVLGILEQAQKKYGNTVLQSTALTRSQFNAAWTDFKATWGQAVNLVLIPILQAATQILNTVTAVLQKIFHLTGKQLGATSKVSSSIGSAASNQDSLTDNVKDTNKALKDTNKELKKELASFDELEILSRNTANNATSGSAGNGGSVSTVGGDAGGLGGEPIVNQGEIDAKLAAIAGLVGAALVGLGILVMFSGKFLLGLGMVALGAATVWTAAEMLENLPEEQKPKLENIFNIVGKAAFMVGLILLFIPGCWKFGLGLMGVGASSLKLAESLSTNKEGQENLKTKLSKMIMLVGIIAFMVGLVLLFIPGCWKFGLGLMAKGAFAVGGATVLGGDELKQELQNFCVKYWKTLYEIGMIMVCIGLVLLFVDAKKTWKIAITLILVGIADLVGTTVLGGDKLKQELQTTCDKYWKEIYAIGVIMVVVGILLCFTEIGLPYGITMIVGGIGSIVGTTYMSHDTIKQEILNMVNDIKTWIKEHDVLCAVLGIILLFVPNMMNVGVGLLKLGGKSLAEEENLSLTSLKEKLTSQLSDVYSAVSSKVKSIKDKIGEISGTSNVSVGANVTGGGIGGGTRTVAQSVSYQVPALARGAVLPGGNAFLAVVNDNPKGQPNIEGPASLIKEMVDKSLDERGITGGQQQQIIKEEHYNLSETELMTIMYKLVKGGDRLNGTSLVRQGYKIW